MQSRNSERQQTSVLEKRRIRVFKIGDMKGGWFVGNFKPTAFKTKDCEVGFKVHKKGEPWEPHYQEKAVEINYLISGKLRMCGRTFVAGDIFVVPPKLVTDPEFLTDCNVICAKLPSLPGDKVIAA